MSAQFVEGVSCARRGNRATASGGALISPAACDGGGPLLLEGT